MTQAPGVRAGDEGTNNTQPHAVPCADSWVKSCRGQHQGPERSQPPGLSGSPQPPQTLGRVRLSAHPVSVHGRLRPAAKFRFIWPPSFLPSLLSLCTFRPPLCLTSPPGPLLLLGTGPLPEPPRLSSVWRALCSDDSHGHCPPTRPIPFILIVSSAGGPLPMLLSPSSSALPAPQTSIQGWETDLGKCLVW